MIKLTYIQELSLRVILIAIFLGVVLPTPAEAMTKFEAQNCVYADLILDYTNIKEAQCSMQYKGWRLVSSFKFEDVVIETYRYKNMRYGNVTVVFIKDTLSSILEIQQV